MRAWVPFAAGAAAGVIVAAGILVAVVDTLLVGARWLTRDSGEVW